MTEAQALEIAKKAYGDDAMVWTTTHDKNGVAYKQPRYRIGYPAYPGETRFTEVHPDGVRRFKGVGGSWAGAVASLKACTPREAPKPKAEPTPTPSLEVEAEAVYSTKNFATPRSQVDAPKTNPPNLMEAMQAEPEMAAVSEAPSQQMRTRQAGMTQREEEKSVGKPNLGTYERLKCTPIMLYPDSQIDREEIQAAAKADRRSVSNYILTIVLKHIRGGNDPW